MNVVREIQRINEQELKLGLKGASWHDEYKDSAYVYVGGLDTGLTEGDVITIFSQYGEVMDVHLPREKDTGKARGFGFLMYEDQRSTVLAVDNLNGAGVAGRTLRVDHVRNYRQPRVQGADGELVESEEQSLNARPEMVVEGDEESEESESSGPEIDPEDPMAAYMLQKRKEEKEKERKKGGSKKGKSKKSKGKGKDPARHKDETPEERRARKERKKARKALREGGDKRSAGLRGVEEMLQRLNAGAPGRGREGEDDGVRKRGGRGRTRSPSPSEALRRRRPSRSRSRDREYGEAPRRSRLPEERGERRERDRDEDPRRARGESRERYRARDAGSGRRERGRDGSGEYRRSPDAREARRRDADAGRESWSKSPA